MKNKTLVFLLTASIFFSGGSSLINEFILSSISTMILGNSLEQYSLTIGLMLFAMGIGGFTQQFINDKYLIQKFLFLEIMLALIGSYAPIAMYAAYAYTPDHFQLINYLAIFSIGFLVGFEIPFIIRMVEQYAPNLKNNLSSIFAGDYIGAFVGTLIWVSFLLVMFPFTESSFIVSASNLLVGVITYTYFILNKNAFNPEEIGFKTKYLYPISLIIVIGVIFYGYTQNRNWNVSLEQKLYKDPIVFTTTTKYQHIVVTKDKTLDETRLYINGNVQFSSLDEERYHDFLVHPIMKLAKSHENVLVLGGGDGLAVRELKKYKDIKNLTLIDLDSAMIEFSKTNPIMTKLNKNSFENINVINADDAIKSAGVQVVHKKDEDGKQEKIAVVDIMNIDAGIFLNKINNTKWDVVIIDLPDPSVIELVKLYSKEFYLSLSNAMNSEAIVGIQSTSPYHAKESYLCIQRTLEAAGLKTIPYRYNIPAFGDWGWFIAWKDNTTKENMKNKINNMNSFDVETNFITPELFKSSLVFGKGELDSKDDRINTWMFPVLLDIYTKNSWLNY